MARRRINWSAEVAAFKADRAPRAEVREVRLKSSVGLRGAPAIPLSAWRGRSGDGYVVGVHSLNRFSGDVTVPCVALAVVRGADGIADRRLVSEISDAASLRAFVLDARHVGATELHVHRLCDSDIERAAMVEDLCTDADHVLILGARQRGASATADLYRTR